MESTEHQIDQADFWSAIQVYVERPNVLSNRWMGAQPVRCWILSQTHEDVDLTHEVPTQSPDWTAIVKDFQRTGSVNGFDPNSSTHRWKAVESPLCWADIFKYTQQDPESRTVIAIIVIRELFGKRSLKKLMNDKSSHLQTDPSEAKPCLDLICMDLVLSKVLLVPQVSDPADRSSPAAHSLSLDDSENIMLDLLDNNGDEVSESKWLQDFVVPKLRKWAINSSKESSGSSHSGSLALVSLQLYCRKYEELKSRYAPKLMEIWSSIENTDPKKFVYEDIAIAAYLIALWEGSEDLPTTVNFLDLGCGNGLLVHLLNQEGYKGLGWDVRKRRIWSHYEGKLPTRLEEFTFQPAIEDSESTINVIKRLADEGINWIIGNHSDELTPWIPYLSSVLNANCFLLPCCSYEFSGNKFQRTVAGKSKYAAYLDYVEQVCREVGFQTVEKDKMRIPSTKKICFVCKSTSLTSQDAVRKERRINFVQQRLSSSDSDQVTVRSTVEPVRNCTQLKADLKQQLITTITECIAKNGPVKISQLAGQLDSSMLKELKNQCGGLQTFLKNHKFCFTLADGLVKLNSSAS